MSALLFLLAAAAESQVPERSEGGQTLRVSEAELDRGAIYYVQPGGDSQLVVRSEALLQKVTVTTSRMVGYLVAPFDLDEEGVPLLYGGAFRVPVASLETAIEGGDVILSGPDFLDSARHREVTFLVTGVSGVRRTHRDDESARYELNLSGTLTARGVAREISVPASTTFMPSTDRTMARMDGDLLVLEGGFSLALADLGIAPKRQLQDRVPREVGVEVRAILTTVSPDKSIDPREDPVRYRKYLRVITLLRDLDDVVGGYRLARELMTEVWDRPEELERLAAALASTEGIRRRDWNVALEASKRAVELTREEDPRMLSCLALVHHEMGGAASAVAWQRKAVERIDPSKAGALERARATLAWYEEELRRAASP